MTVVYDIDYGWIVELPQIYHTGVEMEVDDKFCRKEDAIRHAKKIQRKIKLPIRTYNKNGSLGGIKKYNKALDADSP